MRAIFISYRREDSEGQAGRLFDDLTARFGEDSVFMDVAGIEPGRDFRRVIDEHVASCGVLLAMIGKAERGQGAVQEIARHKVAYLMAVGGAAYLVARAIKAARVVAFEDLGMEAIYEFTVQDMPVTVAVDSEGNNVHTLAPLHWREKIAREGLLETSS